VSLVKTTLPRGRLEAIQDRVLWLATSLGHHADRVRETRSVSRSGILGSDW
jgi:hypothetical protein